MNIQRLDLLKYFRRILNIYYTSRIRVGLPDKSQPWSSGYGIYKRHLLAQTLADQALLNRFYTGDPLPVGYGIGLDERCVEYPWVVAQLPGSGRLLLDAGSTLNNDILINLPIVQQKTIHILTLAPEDECYWYKGISYLFADLRNIPIRNGWYDTIVAISTLEHIGFDNVRYSEKVGHNEHSPNDLSKAMHELSRVLRPGGSLYFTVPFGIYKDWGTFQQFDRQLLSKAVSEFNEHSRVEEVFYRYNKEGWNVTSFEDCAQCGYVDWLMIPLGTTSSIPQATRWCSSSSCRRLYTPRKAVRKTTMSKARIYAVTQGILRKVGLNITRASNTLEQKRALLLRRHGINVVLDVGANVGQYACMLRNMVFLGRIISFEPSNIAFDQLSLTAKADSSWECLNVALGRDDREMTLNVSRDLVSSSLLPVSGSYTQAIPNGVRVSQEIVDLKRLDSLREGLLRPTDRVHLKLDVQGYEKEVLLGALDTLEQVYSVESEMSLVPLYEGQPLMADVVQLLYSKGFNLIWVERGFIDPQSGHLWQVDGLFLRRP